MHAHFCPIALLNVADKICVLPLWTLTIALEVVTHRRRFYLPAKETGTPKVGDTKFCPQCGKNAVWTHCLECREFFLKHASTLCTEAIHIHDSHQTIDGQPMVFVPKAFTDEEKSGWHDC